MSPFEKGHKGYKGSGRPKGSKTKNSSLNTYNLHKEWKKSSLKKTLDIDEVDYYLYNDLPIEELYDEMKLYNYDWKNNKNKAIYIIRFID